jgi:putative oxidoreductase
VVFTLPGTAKFFESLGLPSASALRSVRGGGDRRCAAVLGVKTRWVAASLVPVLLGATWAHAKNGWLFTIRAAAGVPAVPRRAALSVSLIGGGAYSSTREAL